jgi:hypothetical protein
VALDADPCWLLKDVLAAIPVQDRALDCSEHVFIGTTELLPHMILANPDLEVERGSKLLYVKTPVHNAEELTHLVRTILSKSSAEPDRAQACADEVFSARTRYVPRISITARGRTASHIHPHPPGALRRRVPQPAHLPIFL